MNKCLSFENWRNCPCRRTSVIIQTAFYILNDHCINTEWDFKLQVQVKFFNSISWQDPRAAAPKLFLVNKNKKVKLS